MKQYTNNRRIKMIKSIFRKYVVYYTFIALVVGKPTRNMTVNNPSYLLPTRAINCLLYLNYTHNNNT
jgi:hypothetical protein